MSISDLDIYRSAHAPIKQDGADAPIHDVRTCARPQSIDGRPLIGAVPGRRGLYVCAGHGPRGISTGPASARLTADAILGREPVIPPELDAGRFGVPGGG